MKWTGSIQQCTAHPRQPAPSHTLLGSLLRSSPLCHPEVGLARAQASFILYLSMFTHGKPNCGAMWLSTTPRSHTMSGEGNSQKTFSVVLASARRLHLNLPLFRAVVVTLQLSSCFSCSGQVLRPQPGGQSVPTGTGSVAAANGSFNQISSVLFINKTWNSKAWVKTC